LTTLLHRFPHLQDASVSIMYPNYALVSSDERTSLLFHHGHYVESLYSLMSTLNTFLFPNRQRPRTLGDLEAENFAWIDFFWSTMGRSGDVGQDIGLLYDKLKDKQQLARLLGNLAGGLVEKHHLPPWLSDMEARELQWLLSLRFGRGVKLERNHPAQVLSPDAQRGLQWYLEGPLLEQIRSEKNQGIGPDTTFIFGHTHKPIAHMMNFSVYAQPIKVYNSGGWIVDTVKPAPIFGGAVVLIDEALRTTLLRMYNEAEEQADYAVRVEQATRAGEPFSPFYERINDLVNPASSPWNAFSEAVAQAVQVRARVLQAKITM